MTILLRRRSFGFTLAELLVALSVLAVIATFNISKVLITVDYQQKNAAAKEAQSIISQMFERYKLNNTISSASEFVNFFRH